MLWLLLLMSIYSFGLSMLPENTKLLLVQTLFRHGDRFPVELYPNDPNINASFYPGELEKLSLLGRKQSYAVGKYLRSRYKDFITSSPYEIYVNSSAKDRCLRSAEANIASFYAPEGIWKFEDDLNWQPIPVHYRPLSEDKFLHFGECPRAHDKAMKLYKSDYVQSFFQNNKEALDDLSELVGTNVSKGFELYRLHDTLKTEIMHNLTMPNWVEYYWPLLQTGSDLLSRVYYGSPELLRLRAGPILEVIIDNMNKKINGTLPDLKVQVYCTHGKVISAMTLALTSEFLPRPPYCATILFELYQMPDETGAVRFLYLNSTTPHIDVGKPHVITLKGCSEFCPLHKFAKITRPLIPSDWDAECQRKDKQEGSNVNKIKHKALMQRYFEKFID